MVDDMTADLEPVTVEGQTEVLPKLTVARFIEDLSKFPQDSLIVASLYGIGLTIPIFQAIQIEAEGQQITILQISKQGAIKALEHAMLEETAKVGESQAN